MHTGRALPGGLRFRLAALAVPVAVIASVLGASGAGAAVGGVVYV